MNALCSLQLQVCCAGDMAGTVAAGRTTIEVDMNHHDSPALQHAMAEMATLGGLLDALLLQLVNYEARAEVAATLAGRR